MEQSVAYIVSIVFVALVSWMSSRTTMDTVRSTWYKCIQPSIAPPNVVFPVVWTVLYIMVAFVLANVLMMPSSLHKTSAVFGITVGLLLNIAWCYAFFHSRSPRLALVAIVLLIVANTSVLQSLWITERLLAKVFAPYFGWIAFAAVMNLMSAFKESGC
jgi:benzodiazapine receptor